MWTVLMVTVAIVFFVFGVVTGIGLVAEAEEPPPSIDEWA